jgi:hypothetical protein
VSERPTVNSAATPPTPDTFARWPLYSGITVLVIVCATPLLPPSLALPLVFGLCIPAILVGLVGSMVAILWCAPAALFKRRRRQALSMLVLPLMLLLIVPAGEIVRSVQVETRFYLNKARYDAEVVKAKAEWKHIAWVDDWSLFVTDNEFVVWDGQDQPAMDSGFPLEHRFGGHFYLVGD